TSSPAAAPRAMPAHTTSRPIVCGAYTARIDIPVAFVACSSTNAAVTSTMPAMPRETSSSSCAGAGHERGGDQHDARHAEGDVVVLVRGSRWGPVGEGGAAAADHEHRGAD